MKHLHTFESFLNEAASVPSNVMDFAKRKGPAATSLVKKVATWAEKAGKRISGGTAIGKNYSTIILDMKYQGSEIYINLDDETIELFGEEVTDAKSFQKVLDTEMNESMNEGISHEAYLIHNITGSGQDAAQYFIDDNKNDGKKLEDYLIQHRNSKEKYDIRDLISNPKSNKKLLQKFVKESLDEGYTYPEGVKVTGNKILDKFAKLIHAPSATVAIRSWAVQGRGVPFMTGPEHFSVEGYDSADHFMIKCKHGLFKMMKTDVKKAEDLYDEVTALVQMGKPKRSTPAK
jgi:hypothetical protein